MSDEVGEHGYCVFAAREANNHWGINLSVARLEVKNGDIILYLVPYKIPNDQILRLLRSEFVWTYFGPDHSAVTTGYNRNAAIGVGVGDYLDLNISLYLNKETDNWRRRFQVPLGPPRYTKTQILEKFVR